VTREQRELEALVEETFPDTVPHLDLEGLAPLLMGELACDACGDRPYVKVSPGSIFACPTCGARFGVSTRLHLFPL
jgi:hypothetical protein